MHYALTFGELSFIEVMFLIKISLHPTLNGAASQFLSQSLSRLAGVEIIKITA